jgi:hypothetical protein
MASIMGFSRMNQKFFTKVESKNRRSRQSRRARFELLESRRVLATLTVNPASLTLNEGNYSQGDGYVSYTLVPNSANEIIFQSDTSLLKVSGQIDSYSFLYENNLGQDQHQQIMQSMPPPVISS